MQKFILCYLGDSFGYSNLQAFSTKDRGNDESGSNCAINVNLHGGIKVASMQTFMDRTIMPLKQPIGEGLFGINGKVESTP